MTEQQFTTEELNSEEWKLIPGYNSRYEVSNGNNIFDSPDGRAI